MVVPNMQNQIGKHSCSLLQPSLLRVRELRIMRTRKRKRVPMIHVHVPAVSAKIDRIALSGIVRYSARMR